MTDLPAPPVPPDCDVSDLPLPRDLFIRMAMEQFGVSLAEAAVLVDEAIAGMRHVH